MSDVNVLSEQVRRARLLQSLKLCSGWDLASEWLARRQTALVDEILSANTNDQLRMVQGGIRVLREFQEWINGTLDKGAKAEAELMTTDKTRLL